jgi:SynChlorMet cassette radical SAM/SPASM protein ScmE
MALVMKTPRSVDLEITNRCNLRCKYCSHFSSAGDVGLDLPIEEWLKFFEELKRCSVLDVSISGGEPFYRADLRDLISGVVKNKMRYSILTNGTLIEDDLAGFIASTGRCNYVQVSIDGSIPTTHDAFRGPGNFNKAIEGIKCLQHYDISVQVRVTIHKKNLHDLEDIARLLLEDIGLPSFSTNSASYMGLCRQNEAQVMLTPAERSMAMVSLLRLNRRYRGRISATSGPLAEARNWSAMEDARLRRLPALPGGGRLTGCSGPMSRISVRSDGIIVPCSQLNHIELGRINRDDLRTIWRYHPALKNLREREKIQLAEFDFCLGCAYNIHCTGNCPALAYTMLGIVNHPSPDACLKRFLEEGGRLPGIEESLEI